MIGQYSESYNINFLFPYMSQIHNKIGNEADETSFCEWMKYILLYFFRLYKIMRNRPKSY